MLRFFNFINILFVLVTIIAYSAGHIIESVLGNGISLQFFLGIYQLLFALILMVGHYKKFNDFSIRLIVMYWFAVLAFVIFAFLLSFIRVHTISLIVIIIFPMLIACYQVYAIYKILGQLNNNQS